MSQPQSTPAADEAEDRSDTEETEGPDLAPVGAAADAASSVNIDEVKEAITARGRERGFVTSEEILEGFPVEDLAPEQLDALLMQVEEHLRQEGIEIVEAEPGDLEPEPEVGSIRLPRDEDLLKAPTNDPVRMYLKEIGKVPLLTAAQEVDLAMRIEAGEFSSALILSIDEAVVSNGSGGKVDQKQLRLVVESVVRIREHQLDPEKRLRHEGIARERLPRSYKPKTRAELVDFLRRVERDGQLAKKRLIEANLRLVVSIAKRYVGRGMLFLDLIQEGNLGPHPRGGEVRLLEGYKFSTYATWWIRQAITRAIADQARTIRIPVHMVETINKLARIQRQLLQDLGREPSPKRSASRWVSPPRRSARSEGLAGARLARDPDRRGGGFPPRRLHRRLGRRRPIDAASFILLQEQLESVLHTLSDREKKVIQLRFGLVDGHPRTLEEVGREFGRHPGAHPADRVEDAVEAAASVPVAEAPRLSRIAVPRRS